MGIPSRLGKKEWKEANCKRGGMNHSISVSACSALVCQHAQSTGTWLNTGKPGWNILQTSLGQRAIPHQTTHFQY